MQEINWDDTELLISDHTSSESSILEAINKTQSRKLTDDLARRIEKASQLVSVVINEGINDCVLVVEPYQCNVKHDGTITVKAKPIPRFFGWDSIFDWKNSIWDITFKFPTKQERCFVFFDSTHSLRVQIEDTKTYKWDLDHDPLHWQFNTNISVSEPIKNPNTNKDQMIHEIGSWCQRKLAVQSSYYPSIYLWLRFYEANDSHAKTALRTLLHSTSLVMWKLFAEYSLARQEFARAVYPYSPLAQRAKGEYHLWFCMEYSAMLQKQQKNFENLSKTQKRELNKTSQRNQKTQAIQATKQALKTGVIPDDSPTLEQLEKQGEDWRLHIEGLVLWDAIRQYWGDEEYNESMQEACLKYLNAMSHLNGQIGHNPRYGTIRFK